MSLTRKVLAYGAIGVLAAGVGFAWAWAIEKRIRGDLAGRPHPYPRGRWEP